MDIFQLHQRMIDQHAAHTCSPLAILSPDTRTFVDHALDESRLWPDSPVQLSLAYRQAGMATALVERAALHPPFGEIFRAAEGRSCLVSEVPR